LLETIVLYVGSTIGPIRVTRREAAIVAIVPEVTTAVLEAVRTLDQMLAAGSIENARDALTENRLRRSVIDATVGASDATPEPSRVA
jgi:hypothetical protein